MQNNKKNYEGKDFDLFFNIDGNSCHFASNGTSLAQYVDFDNFDLKKTNNDEDQCEITINSEAINIIIDNSLYMTDRNTAIMNYLSSFAMMARNGFYSYDVLGEDNDGRYYCVLIAEPDKPRELMSFQENSLDKSNLIFLSNIELRTYFKRINERVR